MRVERYYKRKEERVLGERRKLEDLLQEEKERANKLQTTLNAVTSSNEQSITNKILELTKQNSLLDLNLLRLTRKYKNLAE